jgi:hypothetical protein
MRTPMMRLEGPAARKLRRRLARRQRYELALLALAVCHWAYHKNRDWDLLIRELTSADPYEGFTDLDGRVLPGELTPYETVDLSAPADARKLAPRR